MEFDFSQNTEVDDVNKVPENFRGAYEDAGNGKFKIADHAKPLVEAITGLSTALRGERGVTRTLKGQKDVGAVIKEALGFDTVDEAVAKFQELNATVASNAKVDPAKIKADIEKTFETERNGYKTQVSTMQKTLEKHLVDNAALGALSEAKGSTTLLLPHVQSRVKVVQDGEDYVVRVLDASGDYRGDGRGGFMTVADLVTEMKNSKDFAAAFESDAPSGGGPTQKPKGPTGPTGALKREDMSPNELLAAGLAARRNQR